MMIPIIAALVSKLPSLGWILAIGSIFTIAGMGLQQKVFNPSPVKQEKINYSQVREIVRDVVRDELKNLPKPEPALAVQPFDVKKFKGTRSFSYAPVFSGNISMAGVDSTQVRRWIDESMLRAFELHVQKIDKKKRRN